MKKWHRTQLIVNIHILGAFPKTKEMPCDHFPLSEIVAELKVETAGTLIMALSDEFKQCKW